MHKIWIELNWNWKKMNWIGIELKDSESDLNWNWIELKNRESNLNWNWIELKEMNWSEPWAQCGNNHMYVTFPRYLDGNGNPSLWMAYYMTVYWLQNRFLECLDPNIPFGQVYPPVYIILCKSSHRVSSEDQLPRRFHLRFFECRLSVHSVYC